MKKRRKRKQTHVTEKELESKRPELKGVEIQKGVEKGKQEKFKKTGHSSAPL